MIAAIGAFFTSARAVKPFRFGFGGYHKPSLIGAVINKIDHHAAERLELVNQIGINVGADSV